MYTEELKKPLTKVFTQQEVAEAKYIEQEIAAGKTLLIKSHPRGKTFRFIDKNALGESQFRKRQWSHGGKIFTCYEE